VKGMFSPAVLDEAMAEVAQRVQRSLVVVHNGQRGAGAGVVWRAGGYIITNQHVIAHGKPAVSLPDRSERSARIIAQAPDFDLALLQIDAPEAPPALIADSHDMRVGQIVFAIGHPWGQRGYVTAGVISSLDTAHTRNGHGSIPIIRSDVLLAPGNSGGPLVNAAGGVLGINTMIVGGDQGVAIPSQVVDSFVSDSLGERGGAVI
jgi:serine protease Do